MNRYTVFLLFCFVLSACYSTDQAPPLEITKKSKDKNNAAKSDTLPFPLSWLGNWEGDLNIYKDNQIVQTIPMELEMLEIDTSANYIWAIIYGEDKVTGRRAYELEIMDASKGKVSSR